MVQNKSVGELERENEALRQHVTRLEQNLRGMLESYDLVQEFLEQKKVPLIQDVIKGFYINDVESARRLISK